MFPADKYFRHNPPLLVMANNTKHHLCIAGSINISSVSLRCVVFTSTCRICAPRPAVSETLGLPSFVPRPDVSAPLGPTRHTAASQRCHTSYALEDQLVTTAFKLVQTANPTQYRSGMLRLYTALTVPEPQRHTVQQEMFEGSRHAFTGEFGGEKPNGCQRGKYLDYLNKSTHLIHD